MQPGTRVTFTDSSGKTWPGVVERIDTTTYSIPMASVKLDGEEMRLYRSVADLEPEATERSSATEDDQFPDNGAIAMNAIKSDGSSFPKMTRENYIARLRQISPDQPERWYEVQADYQNGRRPFEIEKTYHTIENVGTARYLVNFHDGEKRHDDGSAFFDLRIFSNKRKRDQFIRSLRADGYVERSIV